MFQALARRFRQLFAPRLPPGDVAGDSWVEVGPLPPASLMPSEEAGLIPLDLPAPPPLPLDARPPKTRDQLEWEALLARMLARPDTSPIAASAPTTVEADPTPTAPLATQPPAALTPPAPTPDADDEDWDVVIARARSRGGEDTPTVVRAAPVAPAAAPLQPSVAAPVEDEGDWESLLAAAKARADSPPARAGTLVRTPPPVRLSTVIRDPGSEDRAWEEMIARARRRAELAPPRPTPAPRRRQPTGDTSDWAAVIAAAKRRHSPQA
jgi:hypothetical protein